MATIAEFGVEIRADLDNFNKGIKALESRIDNLEGSVGKSSKKMEGAFDGAVKKLGALFALDQVVEFGKKVISITGQFEKLNAVLANTLGSQSAGQAAFAQIQDFAATTNFSVLELTENFSKLANRGIAPTTANLTSIADVANTLGKPLSDVVEAILDVTNTERWNELGIKVTKSGDMLSASFRGQTVTAKATEQGALDLITAIGTFNGVAGSTAAVADTLEGKLSNLEDAFDRFLNTIGTKSSPAFKTFAQIATDSLDAVSAALESSESRGQRLSSGALASSLKTQEALLKAIADRAKASGGDANAVGFSVSAATSQKLEEFSQKLAQAEKQAAKLRLALNDPDTFKPAATAQLDVANGKIALYTALIEQLPGLQKKVTDSFKGTQPAIVGLIASHEKLIEAQKKAIVAATTTGDLSQANAALKVLEDQLEAFRKLGTENQLEIVTGQLEKYYEVLGNPDASNQAVADAAKRVRALEAERDALQNVIDARVQSLIPDNLKNLEGTSRGQQSLQGVSGGFGPIIDPERFFSAKTLETLKTRLGDLRAETQLTNTQLADAGVAIVDTGKLIAQGLTEVVAAAAEGIGMALAGFGDIASIFDNLLAIVADFISQFGKALLAAGIAAAIAQSQLLSNPPAAIAAGVALIALAGVLKGVIKKGFGGGSNVPALATGTNYVPNDGLAYLHQGEAVVPKKYNPYLNGGSSGMGGEVVFVINGETLKGVLRNYDKGADRRG